MQVWILRSMRYALRWRTLPALTLLGALAGLPGCGDSAADDPAPGADAAAAGTSDGAAAASGNAADGGNADAATAGSEARADGGPTSGSGASDAAQDSAVTRDDAAPDDAAPSCAAPSAAETVPSSDEADVHGVATGSSYRSTWGGSIDLPSCVRAGVDGQLIVIDQVSPVTSGSMQFEFATSRETRQITYLVQGNFSSVYFALWLDLDGDGEPSDADACGYNGGTVETPVQADRDAERLPGRTGALVNFGIGPGRCR